MARECVPFRKLIFNPAYKLPFFWNQYVRYNLEDFNSNGYYKGPEKVDFRVKLILTDPTEGTYVWVVKINTEEDVK